MGSHSNPFTISLPYSPDAARYFACIRHLPRAVWLDSCAGAANAGQVDILSAGPLEWLDFHQIDADSFSKIKQLHARLDPVARDAAIPFSGGCLGYFSYEANHPDHGLQPPEQPVTPLISVGLYDWALIQNHAKQSTQVVFHPSCAQSRRDQIVELLSRKNGPPEEDAKDFQLLESFRPSTSKADFVADIEQIQALINAGDCYQVNYSQHFSAAYSGNELQAYLQLRRVSPTPLAAFMAFDWGAVISLSPERFISLQGNKVHTFPIKGTMPRSSDLETDRRNAKVLTASLKDRAENLMIVDLMRNDLSRVCEPGSVETPRLFELQSFPTVHHLVSEIKGLLRPGQSGLDLLQHALPGGSISGAPKRRAMQIIDSLESRQRSIYCGSIFYWSCSGDLDSSIAIRTLVGAGGLLHCWGGGGITTYSVPEQEWQETLDKVQPLMQRLELMQ